MSIDDDCRRLLALLVHEMRSPGAVVAGYLRMLKGPSTTELPGREQKMIEEANRSCGRLLHVVQELSDFAELSSNGELARAPLPLFTLCDDVVRAASNDGADITFVCEDADRAAMVDGNEARLKQAVGALLAALVRERGSAPIEAHGLVSRDDEPHALIAFVEPGGAVTADGVLEHRQMPFDCWRGGMGLMLPIAHRIVEVHRGSLWALPGSRAACALSLPLVSA
ncbi:MAG TPA: HAMP domain-containing sensor histidine kinase [Vicinamibacterales bacterium]|nr:HAMP domain-containing sensor histidine kinase [Vicinamibacterales bacterium]